MLHVFHVDSGRMMTFDMSLALESVDNLKRYVQEEFKIPAEKQVLLISGGECLDPKKRVCSYSAGTDTNPIFLFSKSIIESPIPPPPTGDYGSESDVDLKVQEHCDMPVTFGTVAKRAQLAQQLVELARKQLTVCENIVHDQHLQQQGWSAVVASLEDITFEFKKRADVFLKFFENYIDEREMHAKFLGLVDPDGDEITVKKEEKKDHTVIFSISPETHDSYLTGNAPCNAVFNNDLRTLQRIPVLPVLLLKNPRLAITDSKTSEEDEESNTSQTSITGREVSIYDWMCGSDTMDKLYDHCCRGIEQNQNRASNTKDASVLPDLCMSHKKQLQMMAFNHTQICDIRRRCTRAKEELSINLYHRLKWVMYIEDHILETDNKLVIYNESLKRLTKHLIILEQVHKAPATYLCAVAEVVRRRTFSQHFLLWASELACHLLTIRNEEIVRRKEFQSRFQGHFLSSLFPGMDDLPPDFATQAPPMFDTGLPKLTQEDIDKLKQDLPDMAENLNVPDTSVLTNFFLLRSLTARKEEEIQDDKMGNEEVIKAVEEKLIQAVSDVGLASDLDRDILRGTGSEPCLTTATGLPHLKDLDRGCESETDTEEFEKVGQSPLELNFDKNIPSPRPRTQDASTSTEDNLQVSRSEHEKLKTVLRKLYQLARDAILQLRSEQAVLRTQIVANKDSASQYCDKIDSSWANLILFQQQQEKENLEVISKSYENVISELRKQVDVQNQQIEDLFNEKSALEGEIIVSCQDLNTNMEKLREENAKTIEDLQRLLEEKEAEKEKIAKETTDRLTRDYKAEIESIRSRFKLMTMERSPSDSSLEKSVDFSNLASNSPFLLQMKEKFEMDKERAVSEALLKEREKWEKLMAIRIRETETKFLEEKDISLQNLAKKITEEKDKQIDFLMEREKNLNLECIKYKSTIQQLAESEIESSDVELLKKISALQEEKDALAEELEKCRSQNVKAVDMSTSVAVCEAKVDVTTSPIKQKESKKSEPTPKGILSVESCKSGDRVIVGWDKEHENFRVVQEKQHLYFVHSDYLEGLGLEVIEGQPNKHFCIAEVLDKEYCYARKSDNRYKVPKSTKFFRVKVRPSISTLSRDTSVSQSLYQPFSTGEHSRMTQSQSAVSTTVEEMILEDTSSPVRTHPPIPERDETDGVGPELLEAVASVEETEATLVEQVEQQVVVHNAGAAKWPEHHFAEDSGIVENIDNVEQAMAAIDDTLTEIENENENCDRDCNKQVEVFREQHAYISSTWLEMMLSRVFTKSIQNHKDCIEQNAVRKME
ncbi:RB1-inducible coiled-coil protein 1 isoform X6 [Diabrotica virgifera virgifera]|uniref:RB1-inducible coiled-coil protein 1 n=1 Tax=Diabrotica virgifera virgifera TaxID=50390 RepID=A0ABM5JIC1_DIAVI|nr:RB1-inducible coiled-coil protein 1 isoform X6 [Diabrotica virgifera virgifera]